MNDVFTTKDFAMCTYVNRFDFVLRLDMINFAVASSVIKHTIHGDANITDDANAIKEVMNMNFDIKR